MERLLLVAWLLLPSCSHAAKVPRCGDAMTRERIVEGRRARAIHRGAVPGLELLQVEGDPRPEGAACETDTGRLLRGAAGFRDAARRVGQDPVALALLSTVLLEPPGVAGSSVYTEPRDGGPEPPRIEGRTLVYWRPHATLADDVRVTVNLDTLEVEAVTGPALRARAGDPLERARQELADPDLWTRLAGVEHLDALRTPEADRLLAGALQDDEHPRVRKEIARRFGQRDSVSPEVVEALCRALLHDAQPEVRNQAAWALSRVGGPAARQALEQAARNDPDEGVRTASQVALDRIGP